MSHVESDQDIIKQGDNEIDPRSCPPNVLLKIASYLQVDNAGRTLAALLVASKASYKIVGPYLYRDVYLSNKTFDSLFLGLHHESLLDDRDRQRAGLPIKGSDAVEAPLQVTLPAAVPGSYPNAASHLRKGSLLRQAKRIIVKDLLDDEINAFYSSAYWWSNDLIQGAKHHKRLASLGDSRLERFTKADVMVCVKRMLDQVKFIVYAFPLTNVLAKWKAVKPVGRKVAPGEPREVTIEVDVEAMLEGQLKDKSGTDWNPVSAARFFALHSGLTIGRRDLEGICVNLHPTDPAEHLRDYAAVHKSLGHYLAGNLRRNLIWSDLNAKTTTYHNLSFEAPGVGWSENCRFFFIDCPLCHPLDEVRDNIFLPRDQMRADQVTEIVRDDKEEYEFHGNPYNKVKSVELIDVARWQELDESPVEEKEEQAYIASMCDEEWKELGFQCGVKSNQDKIRYRFAGDVSECECCAGLNLGYDYPARRSEPVGPKGKGAKK